MFSLAVLFVITIVVLMPVEAVVSAAVLDETIQKNVEVERFSLAPLMTSASGKYLQIHEKTGDLVYSLKYTFKRADRPGSEPDDLYEGKSYNRYLEHEPTNGEPYVVVYKNQKCYSEARTPSNNRWNWLGLSTFVKQKAGKCFFKGEDKYVFYVPNDKIEFDVLDD